MKKYLSIVVALMVTLFAFSSFAFTPPAKPANGWYVLDQAGKLTQDQVNQLNQKIENLNRTTKNEYAVVILDSLDGSNIEEAAQSTFVSWGVGKKGLDNGVMLMISVGDRKSRIHTGLGAEGDLPDIYCKEILTQTLRPYLKRGQFYEGVNATIDAMASHMESQAKDTSAAPTTSASRNGGCSFVGVAVGSLAVLTFVGLLAAFFVIRFLTRKARQAANAMKAILEEDPVTLPPPMVRKVAPALIPLPANPQIHLPVVRRTVPVPTPAVHPAPVTSAPRPTVSKSTVATAAVVGLGAGAAALALAEASRREEEERVASRRRREREEEAERARKRREEDDERSRRSSYSDDSSSSSSPSFDSGSFGGGGFGGGDSGGGGASSDW